MQSPLRLAGRVPSAGALVGDASGVLPVRPDARPQGAAAPVPVRRAAPRRLRPRRRRPACRQARGRRPDDARDVAVSRATAGGGPRPDRAPGRGGHAARRVLPPGLPPPAPVGARQGRGTEPHGHIQGTGGGQRGHRGGGAGSRRRRPADRRERGRRVGRVRRRGRAVGARGHAEGRAGDERRGRPAAGRGPHAGGRADLRGGPPRRRGDRVARMVRRRNPAGALPRRGQEDARIRDRWDGSAARSPD